MEAKKNKMCKVRLRRLRPELIDKLKTKRIMARADVQFSSSSSESEDEDAPVVEKVSVQLKSPLDISDKDFNPFFMLAESSQQVISLTASMHFSEMNSGKMDMDEFTNNANNSLNIAKPGASCTEKVKKKTKHSKQKSHHYPTSPLDRTGGHQRHDKLFSTIDTDLVYYHSDGEGACSYNCNHARVSDSGVAAKALSSSPTRRSSTGSSCSLLSDKCTMQFSKLFDSNCISVMDDDNPPTALSKILAIKEFDPLAPQQLVALIIKSIVSLAELSLREDNVINVDIDKRRLIEISSMSQEDRENLRLNPLMDVSDIVVTHPDDEFFTFCLCKNCEEYRELVIHIMVEQFKAAHMVVMLLDVLIKAYGPMLKNITAYNKFEKLLDSNKEIYWITCGVIYHKKGEHLDFIYDEYLSDNMIFVLFSSILMLNNPLLLLQILAFHVECVVKAYAEGFLEIVEPDQSKIPADEMINYILNGYEDLMRISDQVASYLFAFENDFLRKFSLTWKLLCQRLYQQHLHLHLADTMLACIITLKEEELTSHHTELIKRYIQFDDIMNCVEKRWTEVWVELNKFNLSEVERKRRKSLLDVYRIFDTVVQDAIAFSLQDSVDDNDFYDFRSLKNRRLAWKNIMSYTKMKWPDGFYQPPNTLVVDEKCKLCNVSLDYHVEYCKCITCSIANGPLPPKRNADGKCSKCLAHEIVEKDVNFYDSKIVNVCANDDFQNLMKNNSGAKRKNTALEEVSQDLYTTLASVEELLCENVMDLGYEHIPDGTPHSYHISWAVFSHVNNRRRFPYSTIEQIHFCHPCKLPSCQLARSILNNEISPSLSQDLVHYFQPMSMSREELRLILPNIMLYNRKLVASNNGLDLIDVHDLVVKIYWIFIISVYAIYFIDFAEDHEEKEEPSVNLDALELLHHDINVNVKKIVGNKDDTKFLEFLDKIKSLSPYNNDVESNFDAVINMESAEIQKKLNDILRISDDVDETSPCENIPPPLDTPMEEQHGADLNCTNTVESQPKKGFSCKEKSKKCCFDHSDLGDHCKENHTSKKRLKKDCNHARMNETRDRLRKKLSQIVSARKNSKGPQMATPVNASAAAPAPASAPAPAPEAHAQGDTALKAHELKLFQQFQQQLPHSASIIAATFEQMQETKRIEKLHDLCECLQHLQTNPKQSNDNSKMPNNKKNQHKSCTQKIPEQACLEPPNKKSNISNSSTRDASTSSNGAKSREHNNETIKTTTTEPKTPLATAENNTSTTASLSNMSKTSNSLDFVSEICEIIDNYSKEQAKRKWIKETLSFIEGPDTIAGKKKSQPQTLNPKKAAKKAKQKQRKEEEKRIAELLDLRGQFHNIYFKEFAEKYLLRALKANKKRDKKKITELENNIKNLQRAKAKVETAILELIATVKQTNTEFKFPYLPTKEQQQEKVKELEGPTLEDKEELDIKVNASQLYNSNESPVPSTAFAIRQTNNLNMVPEAYSMPYAHANHFPYNLGFPPPAAPVPFGMMRASPMCYAPPQGAAAAAVGQHQPHLVSAAAASTASNNNVDPSKRIVTIRRVNLPNVPEPQVTVTAKGASPDKDKLLYTFINGQLVQTRTVGSVGAAQKTTSQAAGHIAKLPAEPALSLPPPPPQKLSKTQIKKERRRMAKLQAEAEAAEEVERKRLEEEDRLRAIEEKKLQELQQQQQQQQLQQQQKQPKNKKKKKSVQSSEARSSLGPKSLDVKNNGKQPLKLINSNSTTSVSTNEAIESPQLPQIVRMHKATKHQKRSVSTTTSCSAATSLSSNNSTSSQVNTRDNSVSSLKPANSKSINSKKQTKDPKALITSSNKNKPSCSKPVTSNKKPTAPSSCTESSEEDKEERTTEKPSHFSNLQSKSSKSNTKTQQKVSKASQQRISQPKLHASTDTEDDLANKNQQSIQKSKKPSKRQPKLVDNGQFDNNPFKSLNMQESDSEWDSSEDDEENNMASEIELNSKPTNSQQQQQTTSTEISKPPQIKESKTKKAVVAEKVLQQPKNKAECDSKGKKPQKSLSNENAGTNSSEKQPQKTANTKLSRQKSDEKSAKRSSTTSTSTNQINTNGKSQQRQPQEDSATKKSANQRTTKQVTLPPVSNSNNRKTKNEMRAANNASTSAQNPKSNSSTNGGCGNSSRLRNNTRNSNQNHTHQQQNSDEIQNTHQHGASSANGTHAESKSKRNQRGKKFQQKNSKSMQSQQQQNCCSGIPNNMGYFNPNDVNIAPSSNQSAATQNLSYHTLAEQMQSLSLTNNLGHVPSTTSSTSCHPNELQQQVSINNNVSIMDQLNRGVQVENLSLPPGITLTKVDPIKSEQLRQKSESIKKLSKPLQQQSQQQHPHAFHHHPAMGSTIIAPPVTSMPNYYSSQYAAIGGGGSTAATLDRNSGIIMVESNPPTQSQNPSVTSTSCNNKSSKNKKRRNKSKANKNGPCPFAGNNGKSNVKQQQQDKCSNGAQPKMITLRNPMFHGGPTTPTAAVQQPAMVQGRCVDSYPMAAAATAAPLSVDQPAAIIKNENGMYTIRNPALHQAVTNGMLLGGYRQFGNVNYYTPQEAAAEAARATMQQQQQQQQPQCTGFNDKTTGGGAAGNVGVASSFSYFSNDNNHSNASHNNISISCTSVGGRASSISPQTGGSGGGGLTGEAAVIQRPTPSQKCISAIGSEIKSAQQQKQKSKEQHWSQFGTETLPLNKTDKGTCSNSFLGAVPEGASTVGSDISLQEKYQQSKYYNGFDVFAGGGSGGSSSSATTAGAHIHHSCGDDSPPPSITGYNSYLDGIPNTGVIRYDDASFLKNLIPGQNLNNEVSIHNVNDSNFARNANSPQAHRVDITPVFSGSRAPSTSIFETNTAHTNFRGNYREQLGDYSNDSNLFSNNNLHLNLGELDSTLKYDFEAQQQQTSSASVATASDNHHSILDHYDILNSKNGHAGSNSHRTSPYLDENTLEGFVQNINSLHISSAAANTAAVDEQSSQLNAGGGVAHPVTTSASTAANSWW